MPPFSSKWNLWIYIFTKKWKVYLFLIAKMLVYNLVIVCVNMLNDLFFSIIFFFFFYHGIVHLNVNFAII